MSDDPEARAMDYVLGLENAAEREAIRREMESDPGLAAAVARWEKLLAPMMRGAPEAAPPADMLARIRAGLPAHATATRSGETQAPAAEILDLRRAARRWRSAAIVASAIAASLAIFVGERALRDRTAPTVYVAAVNRGGEAPALIVRVDMATNRVFVRPVGARGEAGKSLELWYIGDGRTPVSMGLVGARSERLALPEGARPEKAKFAVTVEPEGGSPTGGPTGPVVYAGELVKE